jgi:hypothetical protein
MLNCRRNSRKSKNVLKLNKERELKKERDLRNKESSPENKKNWPLSRKQLRRRNLRKNKN